MGFRITSGIASNINSMKRSLQMTVTPKWYFFHTWHDAKTYSNLGSRGISKWRQTSPWWLWRWSWKSSFLLASAAVIGLLSWRWWTFQLYLRSSVALLYPKSPWRWPPKKIDTFVSWLKFTETIVYLLCIDYISTIVLVTGGHIVSIAYPNFFRPGHYTVSNGFFDDHQHLITNHNQSFMPNALLRVLSINHLIVATYQRAVLLLSRWPHFWQKASSDVSENVIFELLFH